MQAQSITINFTGGIVSPGYLKTLLLIAKEARVSNVRFGLRQQLIFDLPSKNMALFTDSTKQAGINWYKSKDALPNIVSSYPAAGIFNTDNWVREGVYKDIFSLFHYTPELKVDISENQQSFVPLFNGHINWVSSSSTHFWHLYVRFPRTKRIFKWPHLVYTNDIAVVSQKIEQEIFSDKFLFYANSKAEGNLLFTRVQLLTAYIKKSSFEENFPSFSLPYYEGFNRMNNQLWLGIYRRDQLFSVDFLIDLCDICLQTRIGQLYTTTWKSLIIKNVEPADRWLWDNLLGKYRINVRHAANELNWQVEDYAETGVQLKRMIIRHFDKQDVRTYGLVFAIENRNCSSMFGNVIIRKQNNKNPHRLKSVERFDILYKKEFNPNAEEVVEYRMSVEKDFIGVYLVSLCKEFYEWKSRDMEVNTKVYLAEEKVTKEHVYQCGKCYTIYDPRIGDIDSGITGNTAFSDLPEDYCCPLCESGKNDFVEIEEPSLTAL
jgi:rubredoxin